MLFEPVVGVALAAVLLDEAILPDPGRRRPGDPRGGRHPAAVRRADWPRRIAPERLALAVGVER